MSNLILSLPLSQTHTDLLSAESMHDFRPYVSFTGFAFYVVVSKQLDKHLYSTSCLNARNHDTCMHLSKTGCTARKVAFFMTSQDRQTQVVAMATTIIID